IAQRVAVAALERLDDHLGAVGTEAFDVRAAGAQHLGGGNRHGQGVSWRDYFEYSSTISASLMSEGRSARSGMALKTPANFLASTSHQLGTRSICWERFTASWTLRCFWARSVNA